MIALIQRVSSAQVTIDEQIYSQIDQGYVILLGIFENDTDSDMTKLVDKIINLRIMADEQNKMNKSILDVKGDILLVSQFTLCADVKGGRRPSFIHAMKPEQANSIYNAVIHKLQDKGLKVKTGKFGAMMNVQINNDGPVTIIVDSKNI